eukprot:309315_1
MTPQARIQIKRRDSTSNQIIVERHSFYAELIDTVDIIVLGHNEHGELGLGHTENVECMTVLNSLPKDQYSSAIQIYSGYKFSIYTNISGEHERHYHWAAGGNYHGECCMSVDRNPTKCNAIHYFKSHDITIKKICVSIGGQCVFWITDTNDVYANGLNDYGQLGLNNTSRIWQPRLVPFFNGVGAIKDIQCAKNYSVALCTTNYNHIITVIIKHISRTNLPKDVLDLIVLFYRINNVYSTEFSKYGGNGHEFIHRWDKYGEIRTNWGWKEMITLRDRDIVKIKTGLNHTVFLDRKGVVWCCGININGGLGVGHNDDVYEPTAIQWFIDEGIRIKDICCGSDHNVALDIHGGVYTWGANHMGQCGDSSTNYIDLPKKILYFKNECVTTIDCGSNHTYCLVKSKCSARRDRHYLFGSNKYNECITYDDILMREYECYKNTKVTTPHCINDIIEEKSGGKTIKAVYLGHHNTKIIL